MRLLLLLPLALSTAVPAAAQQAGRPTAPPGFDRRAPDLGRQGPTIVAEPVALALAAFDADQDGLVTRAEVSAGAARSFASVAHGARDIGYIGYSEWAARWLGDANALPNPFDVDSDHDNRISAAEISAALAAAFTRFDANRDGTLTRTELLTIRATAFGDDGDRRRKGKPRER